MNCTSRFSFRELVCARDHGGGTFSSQAYGGIGGVDRIHEEFGILGNHSCHVQKGHAIPRRELPVCLVLESCETLPVGISKRPIDSVYKIDVQMMIQVTVANGVETHAIIDEPKKRTQHQLSAVFPQVRPYVL